MPVGAPIPKDMREHGKSTAVSSRIATQLMGCPSDANPGGRVSPK